MSHTPNSIVLLDSEDKKISYYQATFFGSLTNSKGKIRQLALEDIRAELQRPEISPEKANLPLWAFKLFINDLRSNENFISCSILLLDFDKGMSLEELRKALHGHQWATHTTFSHHADQPKYRVVIVLSRAVVASEYKPAILAMARRLHAAGIHDEKADCCLAQCYHVPGTPLIRKGDYHFEWHDGVPFDADLLVSEYHASLAKLIPTISKPFKVENEIPVGDRNSHLFKHGCSLQGKGISDDKILEALRNINRKNCASPLSEIEVIRIFTRVLSYEKGSPTTRSDRSADSEAGGNANIHCLLLDLAESRCLFFHDTAKEPYASFDQNGHREYWKIGSKAFSEWLMHEFFSLHHKVPSENALKSTLSILSGKAKFTGPMKSVYLRVAQKGDELWINLCDPLWRVVKLTPRGWTVDTESEVIFTRSASMLSLPEPIVGGSIHPLWEIVNIPEPERLLILAWWIDCFRTETPYCVLELTGEQGSAKTTTQDYLRRLIDPSEVNNRSLPSKAEDLFVSAKNSHVIALENVSHLSNSFQDVLCVMATGGGYAARTLYTNSEESILKAKCPVILNGIAGVITRPDLLERTISIQLPRIQNRLTTSEVEEGFNTNGRQIFGGFLDFFVKVLQRLPQTTIDKSLRPRMADFAILGEAVYQVSGRVAGSFLHDYEANRIQGIYRTLEFSPVAVSIQAFLVESSGGFYGTVKELLNFLTKFRPEGEAWPKSPKGLGDQLRRLSPALSMIGIEIKMSDKATRLGFTVTLKSRPHAMHLANQAELAGNPINNVHDVHQTQP